MGIHESKLIWMNEWMNEPKNGKEEIVFPCNRISTDKCRQNEEVRKPIL